MKLSYARKAKNASLDNFVNKKEARKRRARKVFASARHNVICRIGVYRTLRHIYAQVFSSDGTHTIASASTGEKTIAGEIEGLNKSQSAEMVGKRLAERALVAGVGKVAFDRSGYAYLGRVRALANGARKAGLEF